MDRANEGRGFTIIEVLVVVAVVAILAGLLIPSLGKARQGARRAACRSNLKQIGVALQIYAAQNHQWLPSTSVGACTHYIYAAGPYGLGRLYPKLLSDLGVFFCPEATYYSEHGLYGVRGWGNDMGLPVASSYYYRASLVVFQGFDQYTKGTYHALKHQALVMDYNIKYDIGKHNHGGTYVNILFSDGHVVGVPDPEHRAATQPDDDLWQWADSR